MSNASDLIPADFKVSDSRAGSRGSLTHFERSLGHAGDLALKDDALFPVFFFGSTC
eukprot:CAMPEP_0181269052 /NCGR_PEP_ID=MMETSP1097-20121128/5908_1 /TAXON_ID=35684 /ORGANISM="Pseudopedinella elastica, Strain CCMP716" /LENGTH=55 /DNA_ID=CAMNT_0023368881 /DNA_START=911 /DNA_END=1078 /DNA_ORIENTATION=-